MAPREPFTGTPADRLVRLWRADDERFEPLLDEVLNAGRQAVIDAAASKLREDERLAFLDDVETLAEIIDRVDEQGRRVTSSLYWFIAEVDGALAPPPPAEAIAAAVEESELFEGEERLRVAPLWLSPEELSYMEAVDRRALLQRVVASFGEAGRFAAEQELLADGSDEGGLIAVVGLLDEPHEDALARTDEDWEDEELSAEEEERILSAVAAISDSVVALDSRVRRFRPVGGLTDLLEFVSEGAWDEEAMLDELGQFLDVASDETSDGVLDARVRYVADGLEVLLTAADGRMLDQASFELTDEQLPLAVDLLRRRCRAVEPADEEQG
ncbi:hypothetical protein [Azospirillum halopraeferens]|uniref:hypothetical protein n=1 Tax=Azospirillum halopraeferens TaxID=34010 RepID=UPI0003FD8916|nr:hypothetical protein [Azospirillum halopraeferens]